MYFYLIVGSVFALMFLFGLWVLILRFLAIIRYSYEQAFWEVERKKKVIVHWRFDLIMYVLVNFAIWETGIWQKVFTFHQTIFLLAWMDLILIPIIIEKYGFFGLAKWRMHKLKLHVAQEVSKQADD